MQPGRLRYKANRRPCSARVPRAELLAAAERQLHFRQAPKARKIHSLGRQPQEGHTEFDPAAKRRQTSESVARSGLDGFWGVFPWG